MTRPKLFLDDTRQPPEPDMLLARDMFEFIALLKAHKATGFSEIHFDHDLGGAGAGNGHQCLEELIEQCELEGYPHPDLISVHTLNPDEWHKMAYRAYTYFPETTRVQKVKGSIYPQRSTL